MRIVQERKTGIFGTVQNEQTQTINQQFLRETSRDDPNTIYNLYFKEYDEEKQS